MAVKPPYDFGMTLSRWLTWLLVFSVAYWIIQFVLMGLTGRLAMGLIQAGFGILGNALAALLVAALVAVVARWIRWRETPFSYVSGLVWSVILGIVLGVGGYYQNQQELSTLCNDALINQRFSIVKSVLADLDSSKAPPSGYRQQVDKIWTPALDCDSIDPTSLSSEGRSKYLGILLMGNFVSVMVYFDAKQYQLARSHLPQYTDAATEARPIAIKNHWTGWLTFEKTATKEMALYDLQLKKVGR